MPSKPKGKAPPKWTTALPAALRTELEGLGHLKKPKQSRREKRKAQRSDGKVARAEHFAKKRKAGDEEDEVEEVAPEPKGKGKKGKDEPAASKKRKTENEAKDSKPKAHQTPLEKLLAKQEGGVVDVKRTKNKLESNEDKEIAWLEAKLGVRGPTAAEKGKWKDDFADDGLDDLFSGLGDLEDAAFGSSSKDYSKLIQKGEASGSEGEDDEQSDEYGVSDGELIDPSDDDDHEEMGEIGSVGSDEEATFDLDGSDDFGLGADHESDEGDYSEEEEGSEEEGSEGSDEEASEAEQGAKTVRFEEEPVVPPSAVPTTAPTAGRYIPPHLRAAAAASAATPSSASATPAKKSNAPEAPPEDPRLRRQINGHLNKLSSSNMPAILAALEALYATNPRAIVSATLTSLLVDNISGRDNLGELLVITYAALVAAVSRSVGVEFPAGVIAKSVMAFDEAREKNQKAKEKGGADDGGFEGRPGSKECENLVAFLAELYNFGVVACIIIYDLVRQFIDSGLGELEVELLVKVVKRSGQQLRQDDPGALKEIITLVKQKTQSTEMNLRTRFMIESLTNLKNNKIKPTGDGAIDNYSGLKKYLSGLKRHGKSLFLPQTSLPLHLTRPTPAGSVPDALRITLSDIRSSSTKGKWWIVGAAWGGDPLMDAPNLGSLKSNNASDAALTKLAKAQGMNTDIRKGVFVVLMSSEDYVDACERLLQLGLTDVQQREIARVLLQCSGNEKTYNPYYTLVAHRMGTKSHSFQITLQYCLWDFIRELGEKTVGGEELVKTISDDGAKVAKVSSRRVANLAKLYAWCVAKDVLSLLILKPVPFDNPKPQTIAFLTQFFSALIISTQSLSPALVLSPTAGTRKDREALERVFVRAASHGPLVRGVLSFFENVMEDAAGARGEKERGIVLWGVRIAEETLGLGGTIVDVSRERKVKCDKLYPSCRRCARRHETCGYPAIVFVEERQDSGDERVSMLEAKLASLEARLSSSPPSPRKTRADLCETAPLQLYWSSGNVKIGPSDPVWRLAVSTMTSEVSKDLLNAALTSTFAAIPAFAFVINRLGASDFASPRDSPFQASRWPFFEALLGIPSEDQSPGREAVLSSGERRQNACRSLARMAVEKAWETRIMVTGGGRPALEALLALEHLLFLEEEMVESRWLFRTTLNLFEDLEADCDEFEDVSCLGPLLYASDSFLAASAQKPCFINATRIPALFDSHSLLGTELLDLYNAERSLSTTVESLCCFRLCRYDIEKALETATAWTFACLRGYASLTSGSSIDVVHRALERLQQVLSSLDRTPDGMEEMKYSVHRFVLLFVHLDSLLATTGYSLHTLLVQKASNWATGSRWHHILAESDDRIRKYLKLMAFYYQLYLSSSDVSMVYYLTSPLKVVPNWVELACQRVGDVDGPQSPEVEVTEEELSL
ncbi:nucleolar MIF4G domain-containing protein 1, partial [Phenoliferia sp. Uapishka_3]